MTTAQVTCADLNSLSTTCWDERQQAILRDKAVFSTGPLEAPKMVTVTNETLLSSSDLYHGLMMKASISCIAHNCYMQTGFIREINGGIHIYKHQNIHMNT